MMIKQPFSLLFRGNLLYYCFIYTVCVQVAFCCKDASNPRLTLTQDDDGLSYSTSFSHTVLFQQDSNSLFVGGMNVLLHIDVNSVQILENLTLNPNLEKLCDEKTSCENVVTVIQQFENCTLVCGTNAGRPACWKLCPGEHRSVEVIDGTGISPYTHTQNSLSLTADGDLYAAAPLYSDGTLLQFRRKAGNRVVLWMHDHWVSEPTFISSFLAKRKNDPINEKIYILFREKNSDTSPEADPWISRVARVCKVDEGGPKQVLQNIWTSFLKARLVCGIPEESLYFNRLQDVFVLHAEDWRDSRVFALFSSGWNSTAVCIYSLTQLDEVFQNSSFKGYEEEIPSLRPRTCVRNSNLIPIPALNIIKDHPEMKDWIRPVHKDMPFYTSNNNYTKIEVDRVQASDGNMHNVILLATDNGRILKILEDDSSAFIISETRLCDAPAPVQFMKLDSERKKLFVGYADQMSVLDLQRCQDHGTSCQECVLSRDPYCAWTERGCTPQTKGGIQNIANGKTHVCGGKSGERVKRDLWTPSRDAAPVRIRHSVATKVPFYLSCPVSSHHAAYWWEHGEKRVSACQQSQSECLLLIPAITAEDYGNYTCKSLERDYLKTVKQYELRQKLTFNNAFKRRAQDWPTVTSVTLVLCLCWF